MAKVIDVPGHGLVEFPDSMSDAQIADAIKKTLAPASVPVAPAPAVAPAPQSNIFKDAAAGILRGAGSIGASVMAPQDYLNDYARRRAESRTLSGMIAGPSQVNSNEERRAAMTGALADAGFDTKSTAFGVGKVGTEVLGTLGVGGLLSRLAESVGAVPAMVNALRTSGFSTGAAPATVGARAADLGMRAAAGAGTGLASAALINPGDAQGLAAGGLLGAALPPAVQGAGALGSAIASKVVGPAGDRAALAKSAIGQGIPLSAADVSSNPLIKGLRSVLDEVPLVGSSGAKQREAVQEGFNKAVGATFGAPETKLTPKVMADAKKAIGSELDRIWSGNALQIDAQLMSDLATIRAKAATKLNTEQAAQVERQLQELMQKANGLAVDGGFANNWQSELRKLAEGEKGLHQSILSELRGSVLAAFKRGLRPQDAAALDKTMGQYKAWKTVSPLVSKAELGVGGRSVGNVPPELLPGAVFQSYGERASQTPLGELSQIGSQFVADRVMKTGGSARAMIQNSALGTSLSLGAFHNPLVPLLAIPGAAAAEKALTSPMFGAALAGVKGARVDPMLLPLYRAAPALAADQ